MLRQKQQIVHLPETMRSVAKRLGQVGNIPAFYFKGLGFRYMNGDRLLRLR